MTDIAPAPEITVAEATELIRAAAVVVNNVGRVDHGQTVINVINPRMAWYDWDWRLTYALMFMGSRAVRAEWRRCDPRDRVKRELIVAEANGSEYAFNVQAPPDGTPSGPHPARDASGLTVTDTQAASTLTSHTADRAPDGHWAVSYLLGVPLATREQAEAAMRLAEHVTVHGAAGVDYGDARIVGAREVFNSAIGRIEDRVAAEPANLNVRLAAHAATRAYMETRLNREWDTFTQAAGIASGDALRIIQDGASRAEDANYWHRQYQHAKHS